MRRPLLVAAAVLLVALPARAERPHDAASLEYLPSRATLALCPPADFLDFQVHLRLRYALFQPTAPIHLTVKIDRANGLFRAIGENHEGDVACPDSYPEKHVVYAGVDDQRTCSACACDAPGGGACTAALSVFKDSVCSMPFAVLPISSLKSSCVDLVPAGLPLGSKTVTALAYEAGKCMPSGGEASGTLLAAEASTFCCLMG